MLPEFLENIAIFSLERRFSKQNSVIRLKSYTLIAIFSLERRFSKQNSVIRLKSYTLTPKFFAPFNFWADYATGSVNKMYYR